MKFTLRQLAVFLATAQRGNISEAASALAMTQSAASNALKDFEGRYQTQLFDRVGKRLQLNALGAELLPYADSLLQQAAEIDDVLERREPSGGLRIGATLTIGNYLAIPLITSFKHRYPLCEPTLHVANTRQIANEVLAYQLDMGMIEGEFTHADLQVEHWRDDELAIFCAPGHKLAGAGKLGNQEICSASWVLREEGSGTRQTFDRAMEGLHKDIRVFLELDHTEAIKRAVDTGEVLGCISRIALEDDLRRGRFVELKAPQKKLRRRFYLITHRRKYQGLNLQRWARHCMAS